MELLDPFHLHWVLRRAGQETAFLLGGIGMQEVTCAPCRKTQSISVISSFLPVNKKAYIAEEKQQILSLTGRKGPPQWHACEAAEMGYGHGEKLPSALVSS